MSFGFAFLGNLADQTVEIYFKRQSDGYKIERALTASYFAFAVGFVGGFADEFISSQRFDDADILAERSDDAITIIGGLIGITANDMARIGEKLFKL